MEWNPNLYDDKHGFIRQYGTEMIHLLHPGKNESILDLGCGTGDLTAQIADIISATNGISNLRSRA